MHESHLHDRSCFTTLTYDDEKGVVSPSLHYKDFQKFMRRLRKGVAPQKVRFFMCGEYGEQNLRPHFHACLFGVDFREDRKLQSKSKSGQLVFRSPLLESFWDRGFSSVQDLTEGSAAYVAAYCVKKVTGDMARTHYALVDKETGEVTWRLPEMVRMSLKPGIGARWFEKYHGEVFPHDRIIFKGQPVKVPRYYETLFKRMGGADDLELLKQDRELAARDRYSDNTPERLRVKEIVAKAGLASKKRSL